jgi:LEA14-like dessication related protein
MNTRTGRITTIVLSILLLLTFFFAYTYYNDVEALGNISAEISSINQVDFNFFTPTIITFTLNISNPSNIQMNQLSSTFDLYIEENFLGSGSFQNIIIAPQSNRFTQVTMSLDNSEIAASVIDILANWQSNQNTTVKVQGIMSASVLFGLATTSHEYIAKNN